MSSNEEEFIAKQEIEKKRRLQEKVQQEMLQTEKDRLKELHYMRCPKCGMQLEAIVFRGVTIDKCFSCEGVWLDNGELEQLAGKENKFFDYFGQLFKAKV